LIFELTNFFLLKPRYPYFCSCK